MARVDPLALPVGRSGERTLLIDGLGLNLLTIQEHPYPAAFDNTWTLLSFPAARTQNVTLVRSTHCRCAHRQCRRRPPRPWTG
ncbi:hypothetical protein ACWCQN_23010 [Streptomyces sp. NPDC001984]